MLTELEIDRLKRDHPDPVKLVRALPTSYRDLLTRCVPTFHQGGVTKAFCQLEDLGLVLVFGDSEVTLSGFGRKGVEGLR